MLYCISYRCDYTAVRICASCKIVYAALKQHKEGGPPHNDAHVGMFACRYAGQPNAVQTNWEALE